MSEKDDDKVEVRVVVESKDSASKVILIALTLALVGVLIAVISGSTMTGVAKPTRTTPTAIRILRSGRDTTLTAPRQTAITTRPEASPEVTT